MTRKMKDSGVEWIGMIPDGWNTFSAFQIFSRVDCKNVGVKERNLLSLSYGRIKRKDIESADGLLPESFEGYNIIEAGDIVLRLTDLQNDQKSLRVGYSRERGIVTSAYLTIRNNSDNVPEYLYYYWHTFDICKGFYGLGAGVRQGLNWEGLKNLRIALPLPAVQNKIVELLNKKCAAIDEVIVKTNESIEEYKKLKQSVITEAVTKGVRGKRPMKDSGFDWIGQIPKDWRVCKLKNFVEITDGTHDSPLFVECDDDTYPLVTSRCIVNGEIDVSLANHISEADFVSIDKRSHVSLHDVIMPMIGTVGNPAIVNVDFPIAIKNVALFRTKNDVVKAKFLKFMLSSTIIEEQFHFLNRGGVQSFVSQDILKNLIMPLPNEIDEIVCYLDKKCSAIDTLISKKQQFIDELTAYKKSLIYEYVTGKKEVPA